MIKFTRARSLVALTTLAGLVALGSVPALAGTVAYWRFEEGIADMPVTHINPTNGVWSPDVLDTSGNNNHLSVWDSGGGGGFNYKADVAAPTVFQTGAANTLSIKNSGGGPAAWNNTLATWEPAQFTIEVTFKPETGGWRTLVGRDSLGAATRGTGWNAALAALYLQLTPDNAVAFKFTDKDGYWHDATSGPGLVQGFPFSTDPDGLTGKWYALAGVSDGDTMRLYLNDIASGNGYTMVAQANLKAEGSTNTTLTMGQKGGSTATDWEPGNFSVGRGMYNGGHGDRAYGFIDEVRFSDTALAPNQLLFAVQGELEVTGTVTDQYSGNPVAGATVTVGTESTISDAQGKYSVFVTPGQTYPITATDTWADAPYSSTVVVPTSGSVTKNITLAIRPHTTLSTANGYAWKVLGNTGSAADYSAVTVDETAFQTISVPGSWDPVVGVTDDIFGWYRLHFTVPASFTNTIPGRMVRIRVGPGSAIDDVDAMWLNGQLIGSTGRFPTVPVPVQPVDHVNPPVAGNPPTMYTGQDVAYNHERLYYFPASLLKPGQDNVLAVKVFDMTAGGGLIGSPILEVVAPTGVVTGTVTAGGAPVANARVTAMNAAGISNDWTWTDAAGKYTLTHPLAGATVVSMAKPGVLPKSLSLTVDAGATSVVNFTTTATSGPAEVYDEFSDGPNGWLDKWVNISLEANIPDNAPFITEPGFDFNSFQEIPSSITVENVAGNRGGILSYKQAAPNERFSKFAAVNSAKIVSALSATPEPTGGLPNLILRLIGSDIAPAEMNAQTPWYEADIEGYRFLDEGDGVLKQRVSIMFWSQMRGNTGRIALPLPIQRLGDVSPTNPLTVTIARTGSVYDTYVTGNADGVTGSVLVHTDVIPDPALQDHRMFLYSYATEAKATWDWARGSSAVPVVLPSRLAVKALRIAGGLEAAPAAGAEYTALNANNASANIDILDAVTLAKQGL